MAANNPRKFEEKIAQHKLRQAQETKEFEKIMEEMSGISVSYIFVCILPANTGFILNEFVSLSFDRRRHTTSAKLGVDTADRCLILT